MADINGKPFIEYRIMQIRKYFPNNKIYLLTHYLSEYIEKYFCNNDKIECIKDNKPLGTGGSIKNEIKRELRKLKLQSRKYDKKGILLQWKDDKRLTFIWKLKNAEGKIYEKTCSHGTLKNRISKLAKIAKF